MNDDSWDPSKYKPEWSLRPNWKVVAAVIAFAGFVALKMTGPGEWQDHPSFVIAKVLAAVVAMLIVAPRMFTGEKDDGFRSSTERPAEKDRDDSSGPAA